MEDDLKEQLFIKNLIKGVGREKPSQEFFSNVMTGIEAKPKRVLVYEPLISTTTWMVLGVASVISIIGLIFLATDFSMNWNFSFMRYFSVPKLQISSTMLYAIVFLSLFLVQIPFLQKYMKNQYK